MNKSYFFWFSNRLYSFSTVLNKRRSVFFMTIVQNAPPPLPLSPFPPLHYPPFTPTHQPQYGTKCPFSLKMLVLNVRLYCGGGIFLTNCFLTIVKNAPSPSPNRKVRDMAHTWDLRDFCNVRDFNRSMRYFERNVWDFDTNARDFDQNVWDLNRNIFVILIKMLKRFQPKWGSFQQKF